MIALLHYFRKEDDKKVERAKGGEWGREREKEKCKDSVHFYD